MAERPLWRCPVCSREFPKRRQAHSCHPVSVDAHFEGKAGWLRELFDELCKQLEKLGPLRVDAVKTGINLIPKHHLGGVRVLKDRLHVGFLLNHRLGSPRITRCQQVGPSAYVHGVYLASKGDLYGEVLSWLKEAYQRAAGAKAGLKPGAG